MLLRPISLGEKNVVSQGHTATLQFRCRLVTKTSQFRRRFVVILRQSNVEMLYPYESTTKLLRLSDILGTNLRQNCDVAKTKVIWM